MGDRQRFIQHLQKKTPIGYRSPERITKEDAYVWYDEDRHCLQVELKPRDGERMTVVTIDMTSIESVKQKDYPEDNSFRWVLAINQKEGNMAMLQFSRREDRDMWVSGIKSMLNTGRSSSSSACPPAAPKPLHTRPQCRAISDVTLVEPRAGVLACAVLTLAGKDQVPIEVPEGRDTPEQIKRLTEDFIDKFSILPSESTSLYRFLRTVVQRIVVERQTLQLVEDIGNQHLDILMRERMAVKEKSDMQEIMKDAMRDAEKNLKALADEIPRRIGDHGTGAAIVSMILQRNIEKMKLINDMTAKAYEAESEVADKVTKGGW